VVEAMVRVLVLQQSFDAALHGEEQAALLPESDAADRLGLGEDLKFHAVQALYRRAVDVDPPQRLAVPDRALAEAIPAVDDALHQCCLMNSSTARLNISGCSQYAECPHSGTTTAVEPRICVAT